MSHRFTYSLTVAGLGASLIAGAAMAQSQITAANPAAQAPIATHADATDDQIATWLADDGGARGLGSASASPSKLQAMPDRGIHGEVGASIGSGGYRSAYGVATAPLGDRGDVTVAVSNEHLGNGNRGYGYGGGDRRSLGIGINLNAGPSRSTGGCDNSPPPKWGLGLPDDAALSNRCKRLMAGGADAPR